jgi:hypothetical protein
MSQEYNHVSRCVTVSSLAVGAKTFYSASPAVNERLNPDTVRSAQAGSYLEQ